MENLNFKKKILVILGPTAIGKTDLALHLAKEFNGELVSCDSRQVYRGLDIGTGKLLGSGPSTKLGAEKWEVRHGIKKWEVGGVMIWMYDVISPKRQYTVYDYVKGASRVIDDILKRGKLPIIVGGTGFYLKALLEGLPNLAVPINKELRKKLQRMSVEELQIKLQNLSPTRWKKMNASDRQNPRRLFRAIELMTLSLRAQRSNLGRMNSRSRLPHPLYHTVQGPCNDILKIGLTAPREILYKRVDERVISRMNQGMVEEAEKLYKDGLNLKRMKQLGLEYGVLADHLNGEISIKDELIRVMQNRIHGYVRRQLTWFKKERGTIWFDITDEGYANKLENLVARWYDKRDVMDLSET